MADSSFSTLRLRCPAFIVTLCITIVALLHSLNGAHPVSAPLSAYSSSLSSSNTGFPSSLPHSSRQEQCPVVLKPQSPSSRLWTKHRNKPPISRTSITTSSKTLSSTLISSSRLAINKSTLSRNIATPRIINGREANKELAKSLVLLTDGNGICTGTLVSSRVVFTAAHCEVTNDFTAIVGGMRGGNGQRINVLEVLTARDYFDDPEGSTRKYDFSVVKLESDARTPARPMKVNVNPDVPEADSFARVAGYGNTKEDQDEFHNKELILYQVDVPVRTNADCRDAYSEGRVPIDSDRQVCAGYDRGGCDSCQGDSGGPLIQYDPDDEPVLVAVVSYGAGCAREGFPGVYVRLSPYEDSFDNLDVEKSTDAVAVYGPGVSIGAIVGGVIVAILVALAVVAIILVIKRNMGNNKPAAAPGTTPPYVPSGVPPPPPPGAVPPPPPGAVPPPPPGAVPPPPPGAVPPPPPPAASYMPNVSPSQGGFGVGGSPRAENEGLSLAMPRATNNAYPSPEPYTGPNANPILPPPVSSNLTTPQQGSPPNPLHTNVSPNNTTPSLPPSIPQTSAQVPSYPANWGAPPAPISGTPQQPTQPAPPTSGATRID